MSRHSPCDDAPNAATVAVTTGRVSLQPWTPKWSMETKNIFLEFISDTPYVVTATGVAFGVSSHGLRRNVLTRL